MDRLFSNVVLTAPIAHLIVCVLFLFRYSAGFGSGIGSIFAITDIFSVSITDILTIYITGALPFALYIGFRFRKGYVSRQQRAYTEQDPVIKAKLERGLKFDKIFSDLNIIAITVMLIPQFVIAIHFDEYIPYSNASMIVAFLVSWFWIRFSSKLNTVFEADLVVAAILVLLSSALLTGISRGQNERRQPYSFFESHRMSCNGLILLRNASSFFIVTDRLSRRSIIDQECKVRFQLPPKRPFSPASTIDLAKRWMGS